VLAGPWLNNREMKDRRLFVLSEETAELERVLLSSPLTGIWRVDISELWVGLEGQILFCEKKNTDCLGYLLFR
jgi:hypothetical protein